MQLREDGGWPKLLKLNDLNLACTTHDVLPRKEPQESKMTNRSPAAMVNHINQGGAVVLRGARQLVLARTLVEHALEASGYTLTFDAESASDLVDYLTVSGLSGLEGAAMGAGLGAAIGLLFGRSAQGAALGLGLGLIAGIARGIDRVECGWRVRAVWELDGIPSVTIRKLEAA